MKNILVCAVDYDLGTSGAYHFSHYILELNDLPNSAFRVWLLTEDIDENKGQRNEKTMEYIQKVTFDYPRFLFPFFYFLRNWAYYRAIRRFQKEKKVDCVIFSQAFFGVLAKISLPKRIKVVGIIHDAISLSPNPNSHFSRKSFWFLNLTQSPLEILANRLQDFSIANSAYIQRLLTEKRKLPIERVPLIYQSIDILKIKFQPKEWAYQEGDFLNILFVKSGFIGGGLEDLIHSLGVLPFMFQLTIVGPPSFVQPIIQNWALPFNNVSLNFKGHLTQVEVLEAMSSNQILCVPSRQEALGLANIEGLANGISVVSTTAGGIPEVLDNGRCGWLAEPQNPASLAGALRNCIEVGPAVRLEKSEYGRRHVENFFTKEIMLSKFLDLFEKMTT